MKMTKCPENHIYDKDKYPECPYCTGKIIIEPAAEKAPKKGKAVKVKVRAVRARSTEAAAKPEHSATALISG